MCDLAKERQKIDAILARAAAMEPMRDSIDTQELIEHSLSVLREDYEHACSENCMRERCEDFVGRLVVRRKARLAQDRARKSRSDFAARTSLSIELEANPFRSAIGTRPKCAVPRPSAQE